MVTDWGGDITAGLCGDMAPVLCGGDWTWWDDKLEWGGDKWFENEEGIDC